LTWSYTGDPNGSELDQVRFEIGDTDSTDQLLQDEEIGFVVLQESNLKYSAAECCVRIAAKFARQAQKSVGPLSISANQKYDQYIRLGAVLRAQGGTPPMPFAGGISVSDVNTRRADTDANLGSFRTDLQEPVQGADHLTSEGPVLPPFPN